MSPDLHHLSGAYAVDALDNGERSAFQRHLSECPACRAEVAELSVAAQSLAALTDQEPPASLRSSVLAGIAQVRPLPPLVGEEVVEDAPEGPRHARRGAAVPTGVAPVGGEAAATSEGAHVIPLFRRTTTWIAAAAAATVLAVGGVVWSPWSADQPSLTAIQQVEQAPDSTTVTKHAGAVTATLAYSRSLDRSALTVAGMPPAPSGKVYQMWYIDSDGARSAGFLPSGDDGHGQAVLAGSLSGADQIGVTVEPSGGSDQPTTQPVMVMTVA